MNKRLAFSLLLAVALHTGILIGSSFFFSRPLVRPEASRQTEISLTIIKSESDPARVEPPGLKGGGYNEKILDASPQETQVASAEVLETEQASEKSAEASKEESQQPPAKEDNEVADPSGEQPGQSVSAEDRMGPTEASDGTSAKAQTDTGHQKITWTGLTEGLSLPLPVYPEAAKRFGHEGIVQIVIDIAADGTVKGATIRNSSGHGILDREVITTIEKSWKFHPPGRELKIVKEFAFELERN